METAQAVRFDQYGDRNVLHVIDVPIPQPAPDEVLVEIRAAGINPGEATIRSGTMRDRFPAIFPSGQGSDLAGVVTEVGDEVTEFQVGDEVLGYSWARSTHATHATVPASQLIHKPEELSWAAAGALYVAGCTAWAAVDAVDPQPGETVAVSAAAGGVGSIVVQLLVRRGARVLAIASLPHWPWLTAHGAIPVPHGDRLTQDLRAAAPRGIDAFIDLFGPQYVQLAIDLGVPPERIDSVAAFAKAKEYGAKTDGSVVGSRREVLAEMADLIADGSIELPIEATYTLRHVRDAFAELEQGHTHGKIVLIPDGKAGAPTSEDTGPATAA